MNDTYLHFENKKELLLTGKTYIIGRDPSSDFILADQLVSRRHAQLVCHNGYCVLTDLQSTNGTWFEGKKITEIVLRGETSFRIADCNLSIRSKQENIEHGNNFSGDTMIFEKKIAGILEKVTDPSVTGDIAELRNLYNKKKENLSDIAFHDTLTGLYNRRFFDSKLTEEINRARRYKHPLTLLMIDIDRFKVFNDTYGHQKGDEVLALVASILRNSVRNVDILCRYGGEEMVIILPETASKAACVVAETCRLKVAELSKERSNVEITVSIGVSEISELIATSEKLIFTADLALYQAKETGRNKVSLYSGNSE
jgi:diguanylate cyclase (GGDEF)-like protein